MTTFNHLGNIPTYDYCTTLRSTLGIMDDLGNCVPMGSQAYGYYSVGAYC